MVTPRMSILLLGLALAMPAAALKPSLSAASDRPFALPPPPIPAAEDPTPKAIVGLAVQGLLPEPFSRLGAAPAFELTGAAFLPALDHRLALSVDAGYTQLSTTETLADSRVAGGRVTNTLTESDLRIGLGLQFHFLNPTATLSPYAGARLRLHFLSGTAAGRAGNEAFGNSREQGMSFGGAPYAGLLYRLGPGRLFAELEVDLAPIDHAITGAANLSSISIAAGYVVAF